MIKIWFGYLKQTWFMIMKNKILYLLPLYCSLLFSLGKVEEYIENMLNSDNYYNNQDIKKMNNEFINSPNLNILNALSEIDGELAFQYFSDYVENNPKGEYLELATIHIADYYYSKGLYLKASEWYRKIPDYFPESNYLENSISYYLNSLVIAGKTDSARIYANDIYNKFSNIQSINKDFLKGPENNFKKLYSIQFSSYNKLNSALNFKTILLKENFSARVEKIDNRYYVLIGKYKKKENAEIALKRLFSRLGYTNCKIIELN